MPLLLFMGNLYVYVCICVFATVYLRLCQYVFAKIRANTDSEGHMGVLLKIIIIKLI